MPRGYQKALVAFFSFISISIAISGTAAGQSGGAYLTNLAITSPATITPPEPVTASGNIAGYWDASHWNQNFGYITGMTITYTVRLNYESCVIVCWWSDFSPVKEITFVHDMDFDTENGTCTIYIAETSSVYTIDDCDNKWDEIKSYMYYFNDVTAGYLGLADSGRKYAITTKAHMDLHGTLIFDPFGLGYQHDIPWTSTYDNPMTISVVPACSSDSDCPASAWTGDTFCQGGDVWQHREIWDCHNPGQEDSACVMTESDYIRFDCTSGQVCEGGFCRDVECFNDNECGSDHYEGGNYCDSDSNPDNGYYNACKDGIGMADCAIYRKYRDYYCVNDATSSSYCTASVTGIIQQNCLGCSLGECVNCYADSDCPDAGWYGEENCKGWPLDVYDEYGYGICNDFGTTSSQCDVFYELEVKEDCGRDECPSIEYFCQDNDAWRHCYDRGCFDAQCTLSEYDELREDCGGDYCEAWSEMYCKDGDEYQSRTCFNNNCAYGYCHSSNYTEERMIKDCGNYQCGPWTDDFCTSVGVYHTRTCLDKGCSAGSCFTNMVVETAEVENCGTDHCETSAVHYCINNSVYRNFTCYDTGCANASCYNVSNTFNEAIQACVNSTMCSGGVCVAGLQGDVNGDCVVDIFDLAAVGLAYGSVPGDANWNAAADLDWSGLIDVFDLAIVGLNFGNEC